MLSISDNQNQFKNSIIEITDYIGQTVYLNTFSNQIDLSNFTSGVYFLTLNDNFSKKRTKIIKQ
ncbi:MAG: T9SS type A sorting domain-containing protein [Bacteroidetes bacterium]|nr:T9SS type A sorting domain-containing protein [Bacteroidota bacterium]